MLRAFDEMDEQEMMHDVRSVSDGQEQRRAQPQQIRGRACDHEDEQADFDERV